MLHARTRFDAITCGALVLAFSSAAMAQERTQTRGATPEFPVFTVAGAATASAAVSAELALPGQSAAEPGIRPPRTPGRADDARNAAIRSLSTGRSGRPATASGVQAPSPAELQDVTLNAQRSWINNQAYLTYSLAINVDSSTGIVNFNSGYPGGMHVFLNAVAGASYLVEFAVDPIGSGTTFKISSGNNTHVTAIDGNPRRLMMGVQATSAGWVSVLLQRTEGSGFYLHEVRISRVP